MRLLLKRWASKTLKHILDINYHFQFLEVRDNGICNKILDAFLFLFLDKKLVFRECLSE